MLLRFRKSFPTFLDPWLIVLVSLLAFAPQIPWMGFVADDWAYIDFFAFGGLDGLVTYTTLIDCRPLAFWIPWIGFQLFGTNPLPWQVWTLLWNILTSVMLWLLLKLLFPAARQQNLLAALIFAIYPLFFTHITHALQLSVHAVSYFLVVSSFYLTSRAVQKPTAWLGFTAGAVLTSFLHLLTFEYFAGLELARWLMIFYLVSQTSYRWRERLRLTLKQGLPFLLVWLFWLGWRIAWMPCPLIDRNTPVVFQQLLHQPTAALGQLAQTLVEDTVQMLGGVWSRTVEYQQFSLSPISNGVAWGMGAVAAVVVGLAFWRMADWRTEKPYPWQVMVGGLLVLWLGFLPIWAIGEKMAYFTVNADRYGMASMVGAALLLTAAGGALLKNRATQNGVLIILIGLGVTAQFRIQRDNRHSWESQQDFYWQLKWRAPQIQAPTALIGNGQLINGMGDWFLTSAIDHLYSTTRPSINPLYYYFDGQDRANPVFIKGTTTISTTRYQRLFQADASQVLVLQYQYGTKQCLWIVSAADAENPYLEEELKPYLKFANLQRIQAGTDQPADLQAFGSSHPLNWCFFYQKARLAEQSQNWEEMLALWRQAGEQGFSPRNPVEIPPFIRAAAFTRQWELALSLTERANQPKEKMSAYLCRTWDEIAQRMGQNEPVNKAKASLGCQ